MTPTQDIAVAVYDSHIKAEDAVKALQHAGFDMKKLSIAGRDYETKEHVVGFFNAGDRAKFFGKLGAFWGGMAGLLLGVVFVVVPTVGPIVALGPFAAALVSTLTGGVVGGVEGAVFAGGAGALFGALSALGIPKDAVLHYETELKARHFLLLVHGDPKDMHRAKDLLAQSGYLSFTHHPKAHPAAQ
ncbi:conserved hypothetical protein [Thiomonas sp. X19]|uniref:general stress protein n=1 Tax=Thiomonas sp. X19 TaxID=1050370 RepID=UPI000B6514C6|nr:DUF1269 domain-containing protein [Thiomonas sp. X19]SCC93749.1 conserved hypothetical protein [Thiomonas sp. X19]